MKYTKDDFVISLLDNGGNGHFNKHIMRALSIEAALIIGELCSQYTYWKREGKLVDDMFYCSASKLEYEIGVKEKKQRAVIKQLENLGILETELKGVPATRYFRINQNAIINLYTEQSEETSQFGQNDRTSSVKTTELVSPNRPSSNIIYNNKNKIIKNTYTNVYVEEKSSKSISENKLNNNNLIKKENDVEENDSGNNENDLVDSCIVNCKNLSEEKNDCLESIQGAPKSSIHARTHESSTTTAHRRKRLTGEESAETEKPKKLNKYQKCHVILEEYMANEDEKGGELYEVLKAYLSFRLEVKDKTFYANQWKGMLNKLNTLTDDYSTKVKIVQQSIDRGYMGFFEVKQYNNKSSIMDKAHNRGNMSNRYTDREIEEFERLDRERQQKGMKTEF